MDTPAPTTIAATSLPNRLRLVASDIKLSHSVFALPFALLATFLAAGSNGVRPDAVTLGLIVLCMVLARTVAMCVNRWADARLDAVNPRTASRAIPRGALPRGFMLATAATCGLGLIATTCVFWLRDGNRWPLLLSPLVLAWLGIYSFTKRFTWMCHMVLGSALAMSPVAAAIAVRPGYLGEPPVWLLAAMVTGWVAGFDVIYALQDVTVDREQGLHSIPSRLGVRAALWISRVLHIVASAALVAAWWISPLLGSFFAAGLGIMAALLLLEHVIVWRSGTGRMQMALFTLNGLVSLAIGGLGIADVLLALC